jgi:Domain of unknown function (DUF4832)/Domain of unknown function (DUF4874)
MTLAGRIPAALLIAVLHTLVMGRARGAAAPQDGSSQRAAPPGAVQHLTYAASDENFPNPERGFYRQSSPLWLGTARSALSAARLRPYREEGIALIRAYYVIDEFREAPLSSDALAAIGADFQAVRQAGLKVIPRFTYNFPTSGSYHEAIDAPLARVVEHISQLTAVLHAYSDVIAFVEAGFIGAWGEWHSSSNAFLNPDHSLAAGAATIVERLLMALPETRMVALRYPYHKQQMFGLEPLSPDQAFTAMPQARVGAHNDCFASNATNGGTYAAPPAYSQAISDLKAYLRADNRFVPQGGETCGTDVEADVFDQPYVHCASALVDFALLRWSTIHIAYKPEVIDLWRSEGCFDEIQKRLGYRFRLVDGDLPAEIARGAPFRIRIAIANDGWAAPYNPRLVELILRHSASGQVQRFPLGADPRLWGAGETQNLDVTLTLPAAFDSGEYEILLNLPDPESGLYRRSDYSIRLANVGVWEMATGFNMLGRVTVLP